MHIQENFLKVAFYLIKPPPWLLLQIMANDLHMSSLKSLMQKIVITRSGSYLPVLFMCKDRLPTKHSITFWEQIPVEQLVSSTSSSLPNKIWPGKLPKSSSFVQKLFKERTDNLLILCQISEHLDRGMGGRARYLHSEGPYYMTTVLFISSSPDVLQQMARVQGLKLLTSLLRQQRKED